jgi:hypothetical protein
MTDRANEPLKFRGGEPSYQRVIDEVVGELIARRGYDDVIYSLVATVYDLAKISVADPQNYAKQREFSMWASTVRTAILKHDGENTFERSINKDDRLLSREMGITLD